jgi:hypothetical protein
MPHDERSASMPTAAERPPRARLQPEMHSTLEALHYVPGSEFQHSEGRLGHL